MHKCIWRPTDCGTFCLSVAKHIKLSSILIWKNGGYFHVQDTKGDLKLSFPTLFTGSFHVEGGWDDTGLMVVVGAGHGIIPEITLSWLESDD